MKQGKKLVQRAEDTGDARGGVPGKATLTSRLRRGPSVDAIATAMIAQLSRAADPALELDGAEAGAIAQAGFAGPGTEPPHLATIQRSFGKHDVSGVRAHIGGAAAEASEALGARAYASGDQVAFAEQPDLFLVAHELAHVVQQRGGVQLSGGIGQAGDQYEQHADQVASVVVRGESVEGLLDQFAGGAPVQRAVQLDPMRGTSRRREAAGDGTPSTAERHDVRFQYTANIDEFIARAARSIADKIRYRSDGGAFARDMIRNNSNVPSVWRELASRGTREGQTVAFRVWIIRRDEEGPNDREILTTRWEADLPPARPERGARSSDGGRGATDLGNPDPQASDPGIDPDPGSTARTIGRAADVANMGLSLTSTAVDIAAGPAGAAAGTVAGEFVFWAGIGGAVLNIVTYVCSIVEAHAINVQQAQIAGLAHSMPGLRALGQRQTYDSNRITRANLFLTPAQTYERFADLQMFLTQLPDHAIVSTMNQTADRLASQISADLKRRVIRLRQENPHITEEQLGRLRVEYFRRVYAEMQPRIEDMRNGVAAPQPPPEVLRNERF